MHAYADSLADLGAASRPYEHLRAIESETERIDAAGEALVGLAGPERRLAVENLVSVIEFAAHSEGEAYVKRELDALARHFPGLELAILAVYDHIKDSAGGSDACSCPAGRGQL